MRKLLLVGGAALALAGCSAAEQMPAQWSARPQYYYEPPPYLEQRPEPAPYSYSVPSRPRRSAPLPPADDATLDQAQIAPPPAIPDPDPPQRPALVPMDQDCGWWDPCHLWMGAGT